MATATPTPAFDQPPVIETYLSVQFATIDRLTAPHLGLMWQKFRKEFPGIETHSPINHVVEPFGQMVPLIQTVKFQALESPPIPRCWFTKPDGTQLIQIQADRFMHNWHKVGEGDSYPRYESIRSAFESELKLFQQFLVEENLGRLLPDQCEVAYFNHIFPNDEWAKVGDLGRILTLWRGQYNDKFLNEAEAIELSQRNVIPDVMGNPVGRLYIEGRSAFRLADKQPIFVLNLTARVRPKGENLDDVLSCLDLGREWIVKSFASITTPEMHKIWGRTI